MYFTVMVLSSVVMIAGRATAVHSRLAIRRTDRAPANSSRAMSRAKLGAGGDRCLLALVA